MTFKIYLMNNAEFYDRFKKCDSSDEFYEIFKQARQHWEKHVEDFDKAILLNRNLPYCLRFIVTDEDGNILGYIGARVLPHTLYAFDVFVDKRYRNQGVATFLYNNLKDILKREYKASDDRIGLRIYTDNAEAVKLMAKLGFVEGDSGLAMATAPNEIQLMLTREMLCK